MPGGGGVGGGVLWAQREKEEEVQMHTGETQTLQTGGGIQTC